VRATATDVGRSVVWSLIHIRLLVQKVTKTQVCNAKNGVWLSAGLACKLNQAKTGRNAVGALAPSGKYDEVAGAAAAMRLSLPFL